MNRVRRIPIAMCSDRSFQTIRTPGASLRLLSAIAAILSLLASSGCTLVPDIKHKPQYHNPFPQLSRVAVLPFRNQSQEPTLSGARVAQAYCSELQAIPGFEVLPTGVVENQWLAFENNILRRPAATADDFQRFAEYLGVDAVLQGAVTDYSPYYPPRMTMKVNWYAANPGYHPIPAGYGLPWGTKQEKKIPQWVRLEAERSLAREQLKSQTPTNPDRATDAPDPANDSNASPHDPSQETTDDPFPVTTSSQEAVKGKPVQDDLPEPVPMTDRMLSQQADSVTSPNDADTESEPNAFASELPDDWPDPEGFIPEKPSRNRPELIAQYEPVISHMKAYNGSDEDFTEALGEYFYFRDDARFGGWQAYLQRSEDFIRFCCHRHVVETLAARGGQLESRLILRWPLGRYER